jgi:ABC-type multidrug transport system fused ATPase/permease subunit
MTVGARTAGPLEIARTFIRDIAAYAGRRGVVAGGLVALGALLEGLGLVLLVPLLGLVFGPAPAVVERTFAALGIHGALGRLAVVLAAFSLLLVVRAAVVYARDMTLAELQSGFVEAQRRRVTGRLAAVSWDQVARLRHARVVHVMSADIQRAGLGAHVLLQGLTAAVMLAMQAAIAIALSPALAAIAIGLLAAAGLALVPLLRRSHRLGGAVTNAQFSLLDTTQRFLGGLKLAAAQGLQARFVAEFDTSLQTLRQRQLDTARQQSRSGLVLTTGAALVAAALVLLGFGVLHLAPPVLATLIVVIGRMLGPARQIQQGAQHFVHALPAYAKISELLADLPPPAPGPRSSDVPLPDGAIVFDAVSFGHDGTAGVTGLDLVLAPGEFVGVTGPSGAGKTTFADLLIGLLPPHSGTISVGGRPLDAASLPAWRNQTAYVAQDAWLFHDSVGRNLRWSSPDASDEEIAAALRLTGADVLVGRMPDGLDTTVGERGTLISGGERQRLALARALLRRPRLLVLDEATSALDPASERTIVEGLRTLTPRPTIVMIAHRLESLAGCDRVLHIDGGRLVPA